MRSAPIELPKLSNQKWLALAISSLLPVLLLVPDVQAKERRALSKQETLAAAKAIAADSNSASPISLAMIESAKGNINSADAMFKSLSESSPGGADGVSQLDVLPSWAQALASHKRFDQAEAIYARAISIGQKNLSSRDVRVAQLFLELGKVQYNHGSFKSAYASYKTAIALNARVRPRSYACLSKSLMGAADSAFKCNSMDDAKTFYQKAIHESEKAHVPGDQVGADAMVGLANTYCVIARYSEALPLYERALAIYKKGKPTPTLSIANVLQNTGNLYVSTGQYDFAEKLYKQCIKSIAGVPKSEWLLKIAQQNLEQLHVLQKKNGNGSKVAKRAVPVVAPKAAAPTPATISPLSLAQNEATKGNIDAAAAMFKRVSDSVSGGPESLGQLDVLPAWARAMANAKRFEDAQAIYVRAISIGQKNLSHRDFRVSQLCNELGKVQYTRGQLKSSLASYKTSISLNAMVRPKNYRCLSTALIGAADASFKLGAMNDASYYYQRAVYEADRAQVLGDQAGADALVGLANTYCVQSKFAEALPLYERALAIYKLTKPMPALAVANVLQNTGNLYVSTGKYAFAEKLYKQCLKLIAGVPKSEWLLDVAQHNLVQLYVVQKKTIDAANLYRQIVAREESSDTGKKSLLNDMVGLAEANAAQGKALEAGRLIDQIQLKMKSLPDSAKGPILEKLGKICQLQRNSSMAIDFHTQASDCFKRGGQNRGYLRSLLTLASLYDQERNYEQAFLKYQEVLPLYANGSAITPTVEKIANRLAANFLLMKRAEGDKVTPIKLSEDDQGKGLSLLPNILHEAAANHYNQGKYADAAAVFRQAAEVQKVLKGTDDPGTIKSLIGSANSEYLCGHYPAAAARYEEAMRYCQRAKGAESPEIANLMTGMACVYAEQKRYREAEFMYMQASRIYRQNTGWESADQARCIHGLASLYYDQGQYDNAEAMFKKTIAIRERILGRSHPALASSVVGLAHLYDKKGDYRQAELCFKRSLRILEGRLDAEHPLLAENMTSLADVYRKQGRYVDAEPLYKLALKTYETHSEYDRADYAACVIGYTKLLKDSTRLDEATKIASKARNALGKGRAIPL